MDRMLIIEHNKREKFVSDFLRDVAKETNIIYLKSKNGGDRIPLRIQMIITFSLIDVFANYWYEYRGKREGPRKRCCCWYDQFCKIDKNKEFCRDKQWAELSSTRMYNFRNSIVHFFGLSGKSEDLYIALAPNNRPNAEFQKLRNGLKERGKKTIIISPHSFHALVKQGCMAMLKDWINIITASKTKETMGYEHIAGIQRVWDKINKEGAVKILLEFKKVS